MEADKESVNITIKTGLGKKQLAQILEAIAALRTEEKQAMDEFHTGLATVIDDVTTLKVNSDLAKAALDDLVAKAQSGTQVTLDDLKALAQLHASISDASTSLAAKVAADDPTLDTTVGGQGNDTLVGGQGTDTVTGP